jgi:CheY-like chemotaxis protein
LNVLCCAFDATVDGLVTLQSVEEAEAVRLSVSTAIRPGLESARGQHGLELKIAHRLVEAQGGRIEVDSEGGGRWSATIVLPKAQRLPILVIDDNRAIVSLFQRYLAGTRYRVVGAETGQKALELVRQVKPAAITLDVMMPSQDGWEILQALRALPESASTPIIVCSILDEPALACSLGADDFIRKPVSQTTLLQIFDRWVAAPWPAGPRHPGEPADI